MDAYSRDELGRRAVAHRRALHAMPEVGLDLPETVAYVRGALLAAGLAPRDCGGGIVVDIGEEGPLVALRADMDALPVAEETGLPFASRRPGFMHACGHDAHAGGLLACAEAYATRPPEGYRVRLVFQPGEEGFFGARDMLAAGVLEGVSAIEGGHVGDLSEELAPGQLGFSMGTLMAASDLFEGAFLGSGGHGAAPHQARDPVPALAEYVMALQAFRNRVPDQRRPFVVSVCSLAAGSTYNVIPSEARFSGTARTLSPADRALAREGLERACAGVAATHGLERRFRWIEGYPPLGNDPRIARVAMDSASLAVGASRVRELSIPSMGGEDFAYYLERVPGCFWFMNTQGEGRSFPNHHPRFDVDESRLGDFALAHMAVARALAGACGAS